MTADTAAPKRATVASAASYAAEILSRAGIDNERLEARLLVQHALGVAPEYVVGHPEHLLPTAAAAAFETALKRRAAREPMSHIVGRRGFWTLDLIVTPDTLDPRPDTETAVEAALERISDRSAPLRILDLGTGSGCILLALLSELPAATGLGVDISAGAVAVARRNALETGLFDRAAFEIADWRTPGWGESAGRFDIVASNPPYIPTADIVGLAPEVADYEPHGALDGGADGLDAYRALGPVIRKLLVSNGFSVLEIGRGQNGAAAAILRGAGLDILAIRADLGGVERCLVVGIAGDYLSQ